MSFPARYPGTCPQCLSRIHPGDQIETRDDGESAVHASCSDRDQEPDVDTGISAFLELVADDAPRSRRLPPACTRCWLHHAGECA